jgi:hypothetical protein
MIAALLAGAHLYVLPWKLLFLLPAPPKACGITSLRYGPADGKWERGSNLPAPDCQFRVSVSPDHLLAAWGDPGPSAGALEATFTAQGSDQPQNASLSAEPFTPVPVRGPQLSAKASKVGNSVRVEVRNVSSGPVLLGDAVALRNHPKDDCVGPGPGAVIAPGETLVDQRPGLLSPSMKIWVAAFTGEKQCTWVEVARK